MQISFCCKYLFCWYKFSHRTLTSIGYWYWIVDVLDVTLPVRTKLVGPHFFFSPRRSFTHQFRSGRSHAVSTQRQPDATDVLAITSTRRSSDYLIAVPVVGVTVIMAIGRNRARFQWAFYGVRLLLVPVWGRWPLTAGTDLPFAGGDYSVAFVAARLLFFAKHIDTNSSATVDKRRGVVLHMSVMRFQLFARCVIL